MDNDDHDEFAHGGEPMEDDGYNPFDNSDEGDDSRNPFRQADAAPVDKNEDEAVQEKGPLVDDKIDADFDAGFGEVNKRGQTRTDEDGDELMSDGGNGNPNTAKGDEWKIKQESQDFNPLPPAMPEPRSHPDVKYKADGTINRDRKKHPEHWRPWTKGRPRHWVFDPDQYKEDEAGEVLRLGDFMDVPTLTYSEARQVINAIRDNRKQRGSKIIRDPAKSQIIEEFYDYVEMFANYRSRERVHAAESMLSRYTRQYQLHQFERAQLGSLGFSDAEEAKEIVPSLAGKIDDAELKMLLEELQSLTQPNADN